MKTKTFFTAKWIAYTAMLTALVIATSPLTVPIPPFGNLYWCDFVIFTAAYLLDPVAAFCVGGIGTFLFDVILGNAAMMLPSLIIHGLQGAAVSSLMRFVFSRLPEKAEPLWAFISSLAGAGIAILGYFIQNKFVMNYDPVVIGYKAVRDVIQEVIGISIAMVICYATTFKKQLKKNNLLPDFKNEIKKPAAETEGV